MKHPVHLPLNPLMVADADIFHALKSAQRHLVKRWQSEGGGSVWLACKKYRGEKTFPTCYDATQGCYLNFHILRIFPAPATEAIEVKVNLSSYIIIEVLFNTCVPAQGDRICP